jgi:restriction system protein
LAVPDFQSLMLPLLRMAADKKERALHEAREHLAEKLGVSEQERALLLPSGRQAVFNNRVAWAKVYLQRAGLLTSSKRGYFQIAPRGLEVLSTNPPRIDIKYLDRFPEFVEFRTKKDDSVPNDASVPDTASSDHHTPEEALEASYGRIRTDLAADLLERVKKTSPSFFETLVVELLVKMGYGGSRKEAGKAIGQSGDEGIDGVINEDRLGLDVIYIQAKKWTGTVGRPEIQKFVGALHGKRAKKGVFLTTGTFSSDAKDYVSHIDPKVVLIDGRQLAELMIDFDLGVAPVASYQVKRIDSDYFGEE